MATKRQLGIFDDETTYPIEASCSGGNAYYHRCDAVEHDAAYASCMTKVANRREGRLEAIFSTCSAAIGQTRCPALEMRKKEIEKGQAIYYISREKMREFHDAQIQDIEMSPTIKQQQPSKSTYTYKTVEFVAPEKTVAVAPTIKPAEEVNGFAAAINLALSSTKSPISDTSVPIPTKITAQAAPVIKPAAKAPFVPVATAGLSMLEIARLRMKQKEAQQ